MKLEVNFNYFDIMGMAKKNYARCMEPVCRKWSLTKNELDILLFLYNNPQFDRAADIVSRRGIAKSHVSLAVTNLESREILSRRFDSNDRRTAHLKLTEQGKRITAAAREIQQRFFAAIYRGVTEEEFELWRRLTQKVCDNIENLDKTLT